MMDRDGERSQSSSPCPDDGQAPKGVVVCFFSRQPLHPLELGNIELRLSAEADLEKRAFAPAVDKSLSRGARSAWRNGVITLISLGAIYAYSWALTQLLKALLNVRVVALF